MLLLLLLQLPAPAASAASATGGAGATAAKLISSQSFLTPSDPGMGTAVETWQDLVSKCLRPGRFGVRSV